MQKTLQIVTKYNKKRQRRPLIALSLIVSLLVSLLLEFSPISAYAELRAFQLKITNTESGNIRYTTSRLDNLQYPGYFPLAKNEVIEIERTWMCYERNDYANTLCKPPGGMTNSAQEGPTPPPELTPSLKTK